jgi:hypothetical protein
MASYYVELAGGTSHGIDAQQDLKMLEWTSWGDAAVTKNCSKAHGIGDEVSGCLRAFTV